MSQADVDVIRAMVEAFIRVIGGDETALGATMDPLDPDIVWYGTVGGLDEHQVAHGVQEVAEAVAESIATWEKLVLETERYIDAGDGRVIVLFHEIARSRHSNVEMETRTAVIYTVRDGKVVEARGYMNRDEALEAAGVSAQLPDR
jgi:ketosteroid isomerase-like protein